MDPGVLLWVGGEDGAELRVHVDVGLAKGSALGEAEQPLLQDREKGVVGLGRERVNSSYTSVSPLLHASVSRLSAHSVFIVSSVLTTEWMKLSMSLLFR